MKFILQLILLITGLPFLIVGLVVGLSWAWVGKGFEIAHDLLSYAAPE